MSEPNRLQVWLATRRWGALPDPLFFLIASPLLRYAGLGGRWFQWPMPLQMSKQPWKTPTVARLERMSSRWVHAAHTISRYGACTACGAFDLMGISDCRQTPGQPLVSWLDSVKCRACGHHEAATDEQRRIYKAHRDAR